MLSYIEIINRARGESGKTDIPLSLINSSNADAVQGRSALQRALVSAFQQNLSIPSEDVLTTVATTVGTSVLTVPTKTDLNVIKCLKRKNDDNDLWISLTLVTKEEAEQLKLQTYESNKPLFYWIDNRQLNILPVPTTSVNLQIRYGNIIPLLGFEDLTSIPTIDNEMTLALISYTIAYLKQSSDPQFGIYLQEGDRIRDLYFQRMNRTLKREGKSNIVRVRPRLADRSF
jgi:hypothetical protein